MTIKEKTNPAAPVTICPVARRKPWISGTRAVLQYFIGWDNMLEWYNHRKELSQCHSPLPDWIADAGELDMGVGTAVQQNSRKGILDITSNSKLNAKINCD